LDSVARRFTFIEDGMHLLGNRHFHAACLRQLHRSVSGEDTFRDHAMHARDNFGELATSA
jgi:hypothetical protein